MNRFETDLELLSLTGAVPFSYDHSERSFYFGTQVVALRDIPQFGAMHTPKPDLGKEETRRYLSNTAFIRTFNHVHSLPLAEQFLSTEWTAALEAEAKTVMAETYTEATAWDELFAKEALIFRPAAPDFVVFLNKGIASDAARASVTVQKIGAMCASIGLDYTVNPYEELGAGLYTEHNIDSLACKVGLNAGLGHIAAAANAYARSQAR